MRNQNFKKLDYIITKEDGTTETIPLTDKYLFSARFNKLTGKATFDTFPIKKLKEGYLKLFEVIIKEGYKSVIIPSLGTGFHCYEHEEVAEMVINLLNEFCKNNDIEIILDLYDDETKAIYEQYLKQ